MKTEKRFFYVVSNITYRQVITSAICRIDGTIFNAEELRQQIANENFENVNNVYIVSWKEFDSEQDFINFFK